MIFLVDLVELFESSPIARPVPCKGDTVRFEGMNYRVVAVVHLYAQLLHEVHLEDIHIHLERVL